MSSGPLALAVTEITFSQTTASDPPPPSSPILHTPPQNLKQNLLSTTMAPINL